MTVHSSVGLDPDLVSSIHVAAGQGVAGLVLERDVAFIGEASGTRFISVPVHNSRGVVGVLNLTGGRITGMDLSDEDLESACSVASHLGQLLHQADSGIDQDTGFPDEHAFTEQVERELSRSSRSGEAFMLIVIQLLQTRDSAKRVGPRDVAALLRSAGAAVQSVTRGYDLVGRQEGGRLGDLASALIAVGYPAAVLAVRIGVSPATIWNLARGTTASVTPGLHQAVAALYDEIWDQPPDGHTTAQRRAAAAARTRAARNRWPTPMGMDDDLIDDPGYRPRARWRPTAGTSRQHDRQGLSGSARNASRPPPGQCRPARTEASS